MGFYKPGDPRKYPNWPVSDYAQYHWLHPEFNSFQFYNRDILEPLFNKLQNAQKKKVTILHIGDSHVQADVFTGELRNRLQAAFGYGGRGMVFPYSTGRTHAAIDYTSYHTGQWIYAKNVEQSPELDLGVSGITSRTYDSNATFRLVFRNTILPEFTKIRILLKRTVNSYDLRLSTPAEHINIDVFNADEDDEHTPNYVDVSLLKGDNELFFQLVKNDSSQTSFEIYGLSIENPYDGGILYHSVGINGAGYFSILRENLLDEQLKYLKPDAVILDIGANDYWRNGLNRQSCVDNMQSLVDILRKYNPSITIIFSGSQDIYRGGYSIADCQYYSDLMHEFCEKNGCAFYDWYWVAGGRYSMSRWRSQSLANRDYIHLSGSGYHLKGELFTDAFRNTYNWFKNNDSSTSLVFNMDSLTKPVTDSLGNTTPTYAWIFHSVRRGQTIWQIASKYDVTVSQIRSWNHLRSNYLWIGQVLKLYTKITPEENVIETPEINRTPVKPKTPAGPAPVYHKVKSGETLYGIALKHHTTVAEIKRLNRITGSNIRIGQVLRIK